LYLPKTKNKTELKIEKNMDNNITIAILPYEPV
jgi:hypothetical protein